VRGNLQDITREGATHLRGLCSHGKPGIALLQDILGKGGEADLIVASLEVLVEDFFELVETSFRAP
jgi:hypothetical protein